VVRVTVPPDGNPDKGGTASCPNPKKVLGGGVQTFGLVAGAPSPIIVTSMNDNLSTAWVTKAWGNGNPNWGMNVSVICAFVSP
jgi:hypothetical protein